MYSNGTDYQFYDARDDCDSCKRKCKNDATCAGVECGINRGCVMWTSEKCGTLEQQSRDDSTYHTCMKYDEGDSFIVLKCYILTSRIGGRKTARVFFFLLGKLAVPSETYCEKTFVLWHNRSSFRDS